MNNHPITTEAIAELVRSHGTIPAPDVGRHFGQPYWTGEIESAATPLIESGQITISAEHGVVWNHDGGDLCLAVPTDINIGCLLMPLREGIPVFRTDQDKANFNENKLWDWNYCEEATPRDIIQYADAGRVFVPGQFVKCPEKRRFRHTKSTWQGTQLIAGDADQIKGIEFDNEGKDKTPKGVEAFTDPNKLFELYPQLKDEAYAIGHSLSSLSKPPPHIRCRIYFVLEQPIREETDYKWLLLGLSTVYPIISASRQPAQPVYGNAGKRRIFKDGEVQELSQPFSTRIFDGNHLSAERIRELIEIAKQAELDHSRSRASRATEHASDR